METRCHDGEPNGLINFPRATAGLPGAGRYRIGFQRSRMKLAAQNTSSTVPRHVEQWMSTPKDYVTLKGPDTSIYYAAT